MAIAARITMPDRSFLDVYEGRPVVAHGFEAVIEEAYPGAKRLTIRNTLYPRVSNSLPNEHPIEILSVAAYIPDGMSVFAKEYVKAAKIFDNIWSLWDEYGEKVPLQLFPSNHHVLRGGETVTWDITDGSLPQSSTGFDSRIREFLRSTDPLKRQLIGWANIRRLRETYDWSESNLTHTGLSDSQKDAGWYMGYYWKRRYDPATGSHSGDPDHSAKPDNWMTFGSQYWAEGPNNGHYDFAMACIDNHVNSGDRNESSLILAHIHSVHKLTRGLVNPDHDPSDWRKEQVYLKDWFEKGLWRPGDAFGGKGTVLDSHQWKVGTLATSLLTRDLHLQGICHAVGEQLLSYDPNRHHHRSYGIRAVAWSLYNLVGYGLLLADDRYFHHAADIVEGALSKLHPGELYWPNDGSYNGKGFDGWQDAIMNYWALRALRYAGRSEDNIKAMADNYAKNCVRIVPTPLGGYAQIVEGGDRTDPSTWKWTHTPTKLAYVFPMVGDLALTDQSLSSKCSELADSAFNGFMSNSAGAKNDLINNRDEINWTNASLGPAVTKIFAGITMGARPDLLPGGHN